MKNEQPPPTLYILLDNDGDVVGVYHRQRDAHYERTAMVEAGGVPTRIVKYEPTK